MTVTFLDRCRRKYRQLRDLLDHIKTGSLYHAPGVAARLRLLVVAGDPLPLLQLCAAVLDKPLMMFTTANPTKKLTLPLEPQFRLLFNGSATPSLLLQNPIDLDVWLDLGASQMGAQSITNRELLKAVGDTVGSHLDRDVHPTIAALRQLISNVPAGDMDMLVQYVARAAALTIWLSEWVLSQRASP